MALVGFHVEFRGCNRVYGHPTCMLRIHTIKLPVGVVDSGRRTNDDIDDMVCRLTLPGGCHCCSIIQWNQQLLNINQVHQVACWKRLNPTAWTCSIFPCIAVVLEVGVSILLGLGSKPRIKTNRDSVWSLLGGSIHIYPLYNSISYGKYPTNNVPTAMNRTHISNDVHCSEEWIHMAKGTTTKLGDISGIQSSIAIVNVSTTSSPSPFRNCHVQHFTKNIFIKIPIHYHPLLLSPNIPKYPSVWCLKWWNFGKKTSIKTSWASDAARRNFQDPPRPCRDRLICSDWCWMPYFVSHSLIVDLQISWFWKL